MSTSKSIFQKESILGIDALVSINVYKYGLWNEAVNPLLKPCSASVNPRLKHCSEAEFMNVFDFVEVYGLNLETYQT